MPTKPGPERKVSDGELLVAIRNQYGPAAGTSEVADRVGVQRQTADKYLRDLEDRGLVNTRKIGQVRVWWLSDEGERRVALSGQSSESESS